MAYFKIQFEQLDGDVETGFYRVVEARSEDEAKEKARRFCEMLGKEESGWYVAEIGYPAVRVESIQEVKSIKDLVERWL